MAGPIADLVGAFVSDKTQIQDGGRKRLMTVREASQYLAVPIATLYTRVWKRTIPFVRLGRSIRFDRDSLDRLIESNTVKSSEDYFDLDLPGESHS